MKNFISTDTGWVACGRVEITVYCEEHTITTFRPFIMQSDSELLILNFRSEKKMGLLMQSILQNPTG